MPLSLRLVGLAGLCLVAACATHPPKAETTAAPNPVPKSEMMADGFHTLGVDFGDVRLVDMPTKPTPRDQRISDAFFNLPPLSDRQHPTAKAAACYGAGDDPLHAYVPIDPAAPAEALSGGIRCALTDNPGTRWRIVSLITDEKHYVASLTLVDAQGGERSAYVDVTAFADSVAPITP